MSSRASIASLALCLACGRDVAQTAERAAGSAAAAPDCTSAPSAVALPTSGPFGTGTEAPSALVGGAYTAGAGPGLFIFARDAFRVYLNGELVRQSSAPRAGEFIPLSILPGDNVLAVVVAASDGSPAAVVQLDELEQSHASGAGWRVSTSPGDRYHEAGYDVSSWPLAVDFGAVNSLAGCDAARVLPADSPARWVGPEPGTGSMAVLRTTIRVRPLGFAEATTGGLGAEPVLVSSWDELAMRAEDEAPAVLLLAEGVHDFRLQGADVREQMACPVPCAGEPGRVTYELLTDDETCAVPLVARTRDERRLALGSNKTLVGLGRGAALRGVSITIGAVQNVIVRNVAVFDVNRALVEAGDAFGLAGASGVWLDHCTVKWVSDGFTDVAPGTQNVTASWLRYDGTSADACGGKHVRGSQLSDSSVTFHHTLFEHLHSHSPLADHPNARVHVFNSVLSDNPDTGVAAACGAQILVEGNVFESIATPTVRQDCPDNAALGLIHAPPGSNVYRNVGPHRGAGGMEPRDVVFPPPYAYADALEPALDAWLRVVSRAGAGGPWAQPLAL